MITQSAILHVPSGQIFLGRRHHNIIRDIVTSGFAPRVGRPDFEQGFVDENGKYFSRELAREHFLACGQVPYRGGENLHATLLFSEDLY